MTKLSVASLGFLALTSSLSPSAFASVIVTFGGTTPASAGAYSTQTAVTTVDFNGGFAPANYILGTTGSPAIVTGTVPGLYLAPTGDSSPYLTTGTGFVTINLSAGPVGYFGLDWSSIDDYNTLSLTETNGTVDTYTGGQIASMGALPADGSTTSYVNFFTSPGTAWNSITMSSTLFAFESDNQAFGPAVAVLSPEPGSWILLAVGLGALAFSQLRRK